MKPLKDSAPEGRVNPKGIPCLYLATSSQTAMAEVRPWIGSYVSLAQFTTLSELEILHLGDDGGPPEWSFPEPFPPPDPEKDAWGYIARAFSTPVSPTDSTADYAPTQVLAELFKSSGCDGIAYRSLLANGMSVALFDLDAADLMDCGLFRTADVFIKFKQAANRYFIPKYLSEIMKGMEPKSRG